MVLVCLGGAGWDVGGFSAGFPGAGTKCRCIFQVRVGFVPRTVERKIQGKKAFVCVAVTGPPRTEIVQRGRVRTMLSLDHGSPAMAVAVGKQRGGRGAAPATHPPSLPLPSLAPGWVVATLQLLYVVVRACGSRSAYASVP